jgi:ubiquinone/menaquinone biosynthesis C-methylase UbiE
MSEIDWKRLSEVLDHYSSEEQGPLLHQFYAWIVEQLDEEDREPRHCLELGCGSALLASKLVDWYPEARFSLVDSNGPMLEIARVRVGDAEAVTIHEQSIEDFLAGQGDHSADLAVFCRSWYALADPRATAAEIARVIEPGGLVCIYDFEKKVDMQVMRPEILGQDPERGPVLCDVIDDFNAGIDAGRYSLATEDALCEIFGAVGGELVVFESHDPEAPTGRSCIRIG